MAEITNDSITYGTTTIEYSIHYTDRKTLGISVTPEGNVQIKAPLDASAERIKEKIRKRAGWILKHKRFFHSFGEPTPPKRYISGESHLYLGRQYMLRVTEGRPNSAKYKGRCFEIVCTPKSKAEELMKEWYRERAKVKFAEIAEPIIQRFKRHGIEPASLYIQEMESRWGSCTPKGKIILNTELIKAPRPCIEYVITHELCHLIHRGHTSAFYQLLTTEMPNWEKWKTKLEESMR